MMKTKLLKTKSFKVDITTLLSVFISGVFLFATIKMIEDTSIEEPACIDIDQTKPDCIKDMPNPNCLSHRQRIPCLIDAANKENLQ